MPHRDIAEVNRVSRFVSHKVKMSEEFDLQKESQPTKSHRGPRVLVKLSFRGPCDSKLYGPSSHFIELKNLIK